VAVVTNAAGLGALCADAGEAHGLQFPTLSPATAEACQGLLPTSVDLDNPINLRIEAQPEHYSAAVEQVLRDTTIDAVIVLYVPIGNATEQELAEVLSHTVHTVRAETGQAKPVLACFLHQDKTLSAAGEVAASITATLPLFRFPEAAARSLAHAAQYAAWQRSPLGQVPKLSDVDADAARSVIETVLENHAEGELGQPETQALLAAAGLRLSDAPEEVDETSVVVRVVEDPNFGPLIGFGLSGAVAEVLHDRTFCITPLTSSDAQELVRSIRGFALLQREHLPVDLVAIEDVLLRVSWLVEECPEICALELQPISVRAAGQGVRLRGGHVHVRPEIKPSYF
jgi:acyl-CoA synthetase (NDP forming)